jgi:hypothetical protein
VGWVASAVIAEVYDLNRSDAAGRHDDCVASPRESGRRHNHRPRCPENAHQVIATGAD